MNHDENMDANVVAMIDYVSTITLDDLVDGDVRCEWVGDPQLDNFVEAYDNGLAVYCEGWVIIYRSDVSVPMFVNNWLDGLLTVYVDYSIFLEYIKMAEL